MIIDVGDTEHDITEQRLLKAYDVLLRLYDEQQISSDVLLKAMDIDYEKESARMKSDLDSTKSTNSGD